MTRAGLADLLDEVDSQLIAGVEETMSPTAVALPLRRTIERLPGLMRDLVERLRAGRLDEPEKRTDAPTQLYIAPLVTALGLLKQSIYALIDERQVSTTAHEMRIVGEWFATVAESVLLAENRRLAAMLDAIPDHLILYDADTLLINYVNRAAGEGAKDIAGMSREEVQGRRIVDIVHDKKFGRYLEDRLERVAGGDSITEELIYPSPDGGRWHEQHMRPVHGPDGKVEAITITSRDIHDRKKAEARLHLLSKLGALAETMDYARVLEAVAHLSIPELADWCILDILEGGELRRATVAHRDPAKAALAKELLRFPPQLHTQSFAKHVMAGKSFHVADLKEGIDKVDPKFAVILRELGARSCLLIPFVVLGKTIALAVFLLTPESGRRYDAEDLALAEEMARRAGQIIENARLHQQLRQSEARFRVALEHANISVFETDLELRMRWIYNARLGAPESELTGKTAREIFGGEAVDQDEIKRRVIETGEGAGTAFSTLLAGKKRHLLVRYEPLRGIGGIVGVTGAAVDVTDLKEAEEQLARELGFRERTMGILGHDLRNPVSAVLALAGLLRREEGMCDKAREKLAVIEQSTRRMNEMIGTLLDFTRLRFHGSLPVGVEDLDLDELVRGIVAELQAAHPRRAIELCASGNLRGRWDPGRIAQLLSNLAANALWHGALESPVRLSLAGECDAVLLSVSNRGPVIPPEVVERLFEPFQQGTDSSGNGRRGLGLGLFIVREIVRAHGGTIDVRSCDDLTTFAVSLPRTTPLTSRLSPTWDT